MKFPIGFDLNLQRATFYAMHELRFNGAWFKGDLGPVWVVSEMIDGAHDRGGVSGFSWCDEQPYHNRRRL